MADRIRVRTRAREEMLDITREVADVIARSGVGDGTAHLWSLHTTCALTVNEGADPDVVHDIVAHLARLAPLEADFRHDEGNSDAHIKTLLTGPGLTLLVEDGRPLLGTWQKVFLCEWDGPRERQVAVVVR